MAAGSNLLQYGRDCLSRAWTRRRDRRGAENVHEIDHRDRSIRLGERRDHSRKRAWT